MQPFCPLRRHRDGQTPTEDTREEVVALYSRSCPRLIGLLTSIGGSRSDAEDFAQQPYLKAQRQWSKVRSHDDPESWVRVLAVRMIISRRRRDEVEAFGLGRLAGRAQETQPESTDDAVPLSEALDTLPVSQRAVVILHEVLDLPLEQVADELQISLGKVRFRLAGAREALGQLRTETREPQHV